MAESAAGVGTTFYIHLPASKKEIDRVAAVEEKLVSGKGKILVMDDDDIVRDVAGKMLA